MSNLSTNYCMKAKKKNEFFIGDVICWYEKRGDKTVPCFGTIYYRYCEESKMKSFLKKQKTMIFEGNAEELKEFYVNYVMEIGVNKSWSLDDRYIIPVFYAKTAKA